MEDNHLYYIISIYIRSLFVLTYGAHVDNSKYTSYRGRVEY